MRRIVSLFITFILCTWALQAQRIVFTPQWTPQSQFAGYYVAQEIGFYQEAGVEVDFQHPSASYSAVNRLYILCVGADCCPRHLVPCPSGNEDRTGGGIA